MTPNYRKTHIEKISDIGLPNNHSQMNDEYQYQAKYVV